MQQMESILMKNNSNNIKIQSAILKILKDGKIHTKDEVVDKIAKSLNKKINSTNSRIDPFAKVVIGQISIMRGHEWLHNPSPQKGKFAITKAGKTVADNALL